MVRAGRIFNEATSTRCPWLSKVVTSGPSLAYAGSQRNAVSKGSLRSSGMAHCWSLPTAVGARQAFLAAVIGGLPQDLALFEVRALELDAAFVGKKVTLEGSMSGQWAMRSR
jgi:hypothetical protein